MTIFLRLYKSRFLEFHLTNANEKMEIGIRAVDELGPSFFILNITSRSDDDDADDSLGRNHFNLCKNI